MLEMFKIKDFSPAFSSCRQWHDIQPSVPFLMILYPLPSHCTLQSTSGQGHLHSGHPNLFSTCEKWDMLHVSEQLIFLHWQSQIIQPNISTFSLLLLIWSLSCNSHSSLQMGHLHLQKYLNGQKCLSVTSFPPLNPRSKHWVLHFVLWLSKLEFVHHLSANIDNYHQAIFQAEQSTVAIFFFELSIV